jgi:hypothetical protein
LLLVQLCTIWAPDCSGTSGWATLSAGRKIGDIDWWRSTADTSATTIEPPPNFVGATKVAIELGLPDTSLVDRQTLHFAWQDEVAASLKRGQDLRASGDLAAARLVFQHLAEIGNAAAAEPLPKSMIP